VIVEVNMKTTGVLKIPNVIPNAN